MAEVEGRQIFQALSENLTPEHWKDIARAVEEEIDKGKDGVVIMHGTDTMAYTAAALSFMLDNLPVPVVLVGSQRSSDRGSSDAHQNLTCAVRAACSDIAEVMVCMHSEPSDGYCYLHPGVKVRKMHTSRRDAFRTINSKPYTKVYWSDLSIENLRDDWRKKDVDRNLDLKEGFNENVALIKTHPGMDSRDLEKQLDGKDAVVFEGTGLGHIPLRDPGSDVRKVLTDFVEDGGLAFMTSQCLYGRVNMNVYETGVDLQKIGVKGNLNDMLPEAAWVKLGWLLGNYSRDETEELMNENLRGEISDRSLQEEFYEQGE
jgi:glutamyl-tRNA(Gln) amidotransferase subunit D